MTKDDRITVGVFPLSGGRPRALPLPPGTLNLGPGAWTPDGQQIVVQGWDDSHEAVSGMYVVDSADGGHRTRLTHELRRTNDIPGDVSPDGSSLVFLRERAGATGNTSEGSLMVMRLDGTGGIRALVRRPSWSVWDPCASRRTAGWCCSRTAARLRAARSGRCTRTGAT